MNQTMMSFPSRCARGMLVACVALALMAGLLAGFGRHAPRAAAEPAATGNLDELIFGDSDSESAHQFAGDFTRAVDGAVDQSARVSEPRDPVDIKGGDLTFTVAVDPIAQNYLTVKFWGSDASGYKTIAYIDGEQIGYRRSGDYEAINLGSSNPLEERFYYNTIMLPLAFTQGTRTAEISLRTYDGGFSKPGTADSRGYYKAFTHTTAKVDLSSDVQASYQPSRTVAPALTEAEQQALIDSYSARQVQMFNDYSAKVDANPNGRMSIVRYQDELRFYSQALVEEWSPAKTAADKKLALERIFKTIDTFVRDYYGKVTLIGNGGHQADWGGYYGALGEALYIVENLINDDEILGADAFDAFLDQPFVTNTVDGPTSLAGVDFEGGELSRLEAWERVLKANFDWSRTRLSYIYNQMLYTYEGAWEASEGLRMIDSEFFEGKERSHQILLEAIGVRPFLGEEVLVGPDGEDLDLFHSLFYHDGTQRWTDDFVQVVMKGLAQSKVDDDGEIVRRKPYGEKYYGITQAGLTRENGFVANYGEATNYLPEYYFRTLNHAGDETLNDEILQLALKNLHARGFTRYSGTDANGARVMRAEQVIDERNAGYPGFTAYGVRTVEARALLYASLEKQMVASGDRYAGPEWEDSWTYAAEAVGFAQQQLADHQYFNDFGSIMNKNKLDHRLADTYAYVTKERGEIGRFDSAQAGVLLPLTEFGQYTAAELAELEVDPTDYEHSALADVDNMFVSLRDGDTRIFAQLNERNRGFAGNGRLHVMSPDHDNIVQIATNAQFEYQDHYPRFNDRDVDFMDAQQIADTDAPQALSGLIEPVAYQPGIGVVRRENFEVDNPYSGYPDLLTARYGSYLFAFNTTREDYQNKRAFKIDLPADFTGNEVLDLVSGAKIAVSDGQVSVPANTALVLKLGSDKVTPTPPSHVDFVHAAQGSDRVLLSWQAAAGAVSYRVSRATSENGRYSVLADKVKGTSFVDKSVRPSTDYFYRVTALNGIGAGWDSYRRAVKINKPASPNLGSWRDDRVGTTTGSARVDGSKIIISSADGDGLGVGDDYLLDGRDINESLHFVSRPLLGSATVSAKIDKASGPASGLMLRESLEENSRYIYFGADAEGDLLLQNRNRDSRHDWQDEVRSPFDAGLEGLTVAEYPYLKLVREASGQEVNALISADGEQWKLVGSLDTPMAASVQAGVVSAKAATFASAVARQVDGDELRPGTVQDQDQVTLSWNKPDTALRFSIFRTTDAEVAQTDPATSPDGWTKIITEGAARSLVDDQPLRSGSVYYKISTRFADSQVTMTEGATSVQAEPLQVVLDRAREVTGEGYTQGSFRSFTDELGRIETAAELPDANVAQLVDDAYDAYALLVDVDTLSVKQLLDPSWAIASTPGWGGSGTPAQNGARLIDGDVTTFPDTTANPSWVTITPPEGEGPSWDRARIHPRASHISRANGTIIQGSNDGGASWQVVVAIAGVNAAQWYDFSLDTPVTFELLRVYDGHGGGVNLAEVQLYRQSVDDTWLILLLERAAAIDRSLYTDESLTGMDTAAAHADEVRADDTATQEVVDAAAADLDTALAELKEK